MNADKDEDPLAIEYARSDTASFRKRDVLLCSYAAPPILCATFFVVAVLTNSYPVANAALLFGLLSLAASVPNLISVIRYSSKPFIVTLLANALVALFSVPAIFKSWH